MTIVFGAHAIGEKTRFDDFAKVVLANDCRVQACSDESSFFQSTTKKSYYQAKSPAICQDPHAKMMIIADARLFNRQELVEQLALRSSESISDSRLILYAYQKWGVDCVEKLIGDFAFAIKDSQADSLFLACDPIGQRALLYGFTKKNILCFANALKPLMDIAGLSSELNHAKLADFLSLITVDIHHTLFKEVKRLPPGHFLLFNKNALEPQIKGYWSAEQVQQEPLHFSTREDYYCHFRELYKKILREQLALVDNPLGSHLSGGLDSSSVTALSASILQEQNKGLIAFAHVPSSGAFAEPVRGHNYEDSIYLEALAKDYENVSLIYIRDQGKQLFEYDALLHPWLDFPCVNPSNLLWVMTIVEEAEKHNIKTILTGIGGNFTISWGGFSSQKQKISRLRKIKRSLFSWPQQIVKHYSGYRSYKPWGHFSALGKRLAAETNLFARYEKQSFLTRNPTASDLRLKVFDQGFLESVPGFFTAIRFLYGIEHWDPTLDKRMVEFCLRTPNWVFKNDTSSRLLVREGLRGIVPDMICEQQTVGMQAADWYKKVERQKKEIEQLLLSWKTTKIADYLELDALSRTLKKWNYQKISTSKNLRYSYYDSQYHMKLLRAVEVGLFLQAHLSKA